MNPFQAGSFPGETARCGLQSPRPDVDTSHRAPYRTEPSPLQPCCAASGWYHSIGISLLPHHGMPACGISACPALQCLSRCRPAQRNAPGATHSPPCPYPSCVRYLPCGTLHTSLLYRARLPPGFQRASETSGNDRIDAHYASRRSDSGVASWPL